MARAPTFSEKVTLELRHDRGGVSHAWGIRGRRPGSVGRKICGRGRERGDCGWSTAVREGGVMGGEPTGPTPVRPASLVGGARGWQPCMCHGPLGNPRL